MVYSYIKEQWTKGGAGFHDWLRNAAIGWRREPVVKRLLRPTRLDRARRLGYKPIQGIIVARVRVRRGGARKPRPVSGRRQKAMGVAKYTRAISLQSIAENRARRKYPNLEVRNSYPVYSDGKSHWFEIILRDPHHPAQK